VLVAGNYQDGGKNAEAAVRVTSSAGGTYFSKTLSEPGSRRLAHRVADEILRAVKNVKGMTMMKIAMVGAVGKAKNIYMCDWDGSGMVQLTHDNSICLGPAWSPDQKRIVYTSFHKGYPDVYMIDLAGNTRRKIVAFPGINSGAAISPDGRTMALTLSKDGNPDLYLIDVGSGAMTRLTQTKHACEASPAWSPDGSQLVFASDAAGVARPQLYSISRSGGQAKRLTFRGSENVEPDWGPDGRIVFVRRWEGRYHLFLMNPDGSGEVQITQDYTDHNDPSWAPDGRHIVYAKTERYASTIYLLDTEGDPEVALTKLSGSWYSPACTK